MNDFRYVHSDMWIGVPMMQTFGADYWWKNYSVTNIVKFVQIPSEEADSIHIGWYEVGNCINPYGIRTIAYANRRNI